MNFESKMPYEILIRPTANGAYFVQVGCATFAFTKPVDLVAALSEYLDDPIKMEKAYHESQAKRGYIAPPQPVEAMTAAEGYTENG